MSETLQDKIGTLYSKNNKKRRMGYTVGAYSSVLAALQQASKSQKNSEQKPMSGEAPNATVSSRSYSYLSRSYSYLGSYSTNMDTVVNGFINNDELKQMSVQLGIFMGYCVQVTTTDGKIANEYVDNVPIIGDDKGCCVVSGRVYPTTSVGYLKHQNDIADNYCIGLGVSLETDVVDYFKHFYGKMKVFNDSSSCSNAIKTLASKGLLYGEIMIPISTSKDVNNKFQNKVIHFKVVANVPNSSQTGSYKVYIPIPVLLLDDYKEVGNILIEVCESGSSSEAQIVNSGDGNVKFEYKSKKFDHKKALIEDFTCEDVKKHYSQGESNDVVVKHFGWGLNKTISQGRARYYLQNSDELSSILNEEIPSEYQESLFRGVLTEDKVYRTDPVVDMATIGASYGEELKNFAADVGLSVESLLRALNAIAYWERGKKSIDGAWADFEDTTKKDGAGYNIGPFSITEMSGGLYICLKSIAERIPQYSAKIQDMMSKIPKTHRGTNKSYKSPLTDADVRLIKEIFSNYSDEYKAAYINTVRNQLWGKNAIIAYKNSGFNSTLGFASTLAHSIWRPAYVVRNFNNAGISGETDQVVKIELTGAAFIIQGLKDKGYGNIPSARQVIDSVKKSDADAKKWQSFLKAKQVGGWYTRASKLILYANNNLDIPDLDVFKY